MTSTCSTCSMRPGRPAWYTRLPTPPRATSSLTRWCAGCCATVWAVPVPHGCTGGSPTFWRTDRERRRSSSPTTTGSARTRLSPTEAPTTRASPATERCRRRLSTARYSTTAGRWMSWTGTEEAARRCGASSCSPLAMPTAGPGSIRRGTHASSGQPRSPARPVRVRVRTRVRVRVRCSSARRSATAGSCRRR